jgi:hypothetical protein
MMVLQLKENYFDIGAFPTDCEWVLCACPTELALFQLKLGTSF